MYRYACIIHDDMCAITAAAAAAVDVALLFLFIVS